jgi:antitoxin component of RelBE/YafQ-DinJ toxin-antitoxin module
VADICDALEVDLPTIFRMCMKQIKIAKGVPFSMRLPENVVTRSKMLEAFDEMKK